jgi:aminoglycoside phosphotransferase (APT) family kinase protein
LSRVTADARVEIVGKGASSDVIAWAPGRVAKLFHPQYAFAIDMELQRARAVQALGAPCPAVFERIEHEGRSGIVFERIDGPLLSAGMRDGSESIASVAERLAELHVELHALRVPADSSLPRLTEVLAKYLEALPEAEREPARAELAHVAADTGLCHMDLHPGNVIVRGAELVVVDWVNACSGYLALDVARSFTLMAYQTALKRDGARQSGRLELAHRYREAIAAKTAFAAGELERALGFAATALLRGEPANLFASELRALIPWRR